MTLELTTCQATVIKTMLDLFEQREREPPEKKKTDINYHSIHKGSNRSYNGVKIAIKNIKKQFKEIA